MLTLEGRTCVFAGATGAIGRGAVKALCEAGMNVVMVTHNPDDAAAIAASMKEYRGACVAMSNANGDGAVFGEVEDRFGSIDVVINKTGGLDAPVPVEELTPEALMQKLQHQISGAYAFVRSAIPYLEKSRAGRIILTASAGAQNGFLGENIADSVARGGIISLTYCLARELMERKITVNCIAATGLVNDHPPRDARMLDSEALADRLPMGRIGTNAEYGAAVAYLASEESAFVTGQVLNLSGGLVIG